MARRTVQNRLKFIFANVIVLVLLYIKYPGLFYATIYGKNYHRKFLAESLLLQIQREPEFQEKENLLVRPSFMRRYSQVDGVQRDAVVRAIFNTSNIMIKQKSENDAEIEEIGPFKVIEGQVYTKRLPNMICIGAKKCGTGAFQHFLSGHSQVVRPVTRIDEPHFFDNTDNFTKGIDHYRSIFQAGLITDLVFEKTPKYLGSKIVPSRIAQTLDRESLKIVVVVCNPVYRAWSDWSHVTKHKTNAFGEKMDKYVDFDDYVDKVTEHLMKNDRALNDEYIMNIYGSAISEYSIITNGLYGLQMRYWMRYFRRDQFIFVDGDKLISEPGDEMVRFQENAGLAVEIGEDDFKYNREKGFYCFIKDEGSKASCLGKGKGRTRGKGALKMSGTSEAKLREFYRQFNGVFFRLFHKEYHWE